MEFKKLEIQEESSWFKRLIKSPQTNRTILFTIIGAGVGFLYFYLSKGRDMNMMETGEIIQSLLVGGFFGFFITNSPCARNRC
jgi:type IV secretory pathway TrbL component